VIDDIKNGLQTSFEKETVQQQDLQGR